VPTDDTVAAPADAPAAPAPSVQAPAPSVQAPAPSPEAPAQPVEAPPAPTEETTTEDAPGPVIDTPEAPADRMLRLRERLARSGSIGRGILTLLTRGAVDEDTWDEIEETLLLADLGPDATDELMENLRRRIQVLGTDDAAAVREVLREELVTLVNPDLDRRLAATVRTAPDGTEVPSVILMVGVNGTGKTTTVGKLARVLVAAERTVVLGAADTFRAAAADQLATWGSRVGVDTVRADRDGADPAAVAFDAVKEGVAQGVDVVIIDTAGRLQNKKGLMDQLGKVRRVAEKGLHGDTVAEVLLVIDATTGQNGMQQARVFSEAVNITGIVLTKLDGTAKGGIVVNVQRELGVPVKMVGLGEGMDDLTPFDAYGFVDALLGD
ncbi:signal recognition particle-docking protein FtsY, partial [Brachybacterium sp. p3-SID957]|uniref:signal recognition particle-docking protein FtsY n=1 Tax=Brachybacterium sp. p3-SID957 TaxID=2916049 RepID=UPI00223BFC14